jgi:hypothetical protein
MAVPYGCAGGAVLTWLFRPLPQIDRRIERGVDLRKASLTNASSLPLTFLDHDHGANSSSFGAGKPQKVHAHAHARALAGIGILVLTRTHPQPCAIIVNRRRSFAL